MPLSPYAFAIVNDLFDDLPDEEALDLLTEADLIEDAADDDETPPPVVVH